jgi:hypothetical protein
MPIWSVASNRKTKFGPANEQLQSWREDKEHAPAMGAIETGLEDGRWMQLKRTSWA